MGTQTLAIQFLDHADSVRREVAPRLGLKRKSQLGQFMTPATVARFMASLFSPSTLHRCELLDAGAGVGALSCAFLNRWTLAQRFDFGSVKIVAYEIDNTLRRHLESTFGGYAERLPIQFHVSSRDFILEAALLSLRGGQFTHAKTSGLVSYLEAF